MLEHMALVVVRNVSIVAVWLMVFHVAYTFST